MMKTVTPLRIYTANFNALPKDFRQTVVQRTSLLDQDSILHLVWNINKTCSLPTFIMPPSLKSEFIQIINAMLNNKWY